MKNENLCFVDFGLEHATIVVCEVINNKFTSVLFYDTKKFEVPTQRYHTVFEKADNFSNLLLLVSEAEKKIGKNISNIILVSKNKSIIHMLSSKTCKFQRQQKISYFIIERLAKQSLSDFYEEYNDQYVVLDMISHNYKIDQHKKEQKQEVINPYKMKCNTLTSQKSIIGITRTFIKTLEIYLEKFKVHIAHYISPCVGMFSLVKEDIYNQNVMILDIGSGGTEMCLIYDGVIVGLENIEFGGLDMTNDIAKVQRINPENANKIKTLLNKPELQAKFGDKLNELEEIANARFAEIVNNIKYFKNKIDKKYTGGRNKQEEVNDAENNAENAENVEEVIKKQKTKAIKLNKIIVCGGCSNYCNAEHILNETFGADVEYVDCDYVKNQQIFRNKLNNIELKQNDLQLFGAINFYMNNLEQYSNARRGFLFKIPSKLACFLRDLLY